MYHASRYKARKRYYEKEENKEKKRIYMRDYGKRPYVILKRRKHMTSNEWLNIINSERFTNYERLREKETQQRRSRMDL